MITYILGQRSDDHHAACGRKDAAPTLHHALIMLIQLHTSHRVETMTAHSSITKPMYSLEVANTSRQDRGNIRRSNDPLAHPELGFDGVRTLYEGTIHLLVSRSDLVLTVCTNRLITLCFFPALRRGKAVNPMGPCLGFRAVSTSGEATPFLFSSYTECVARVDALAAGLDSLELVKPNPEDGMLLVRSYSIDSLTCKLLNLSLICAHMKHSVTSSS